MKKTIIVILCIAILCGIASLTEAKTNKVLWQKYRHELIHRLSRHFCAAEHQAYPCKTLDDTVFQVQSEPADALWHISKYYLNEGLCKFIPKWSTDFQPRLASYDGGIVETYDKFLKSVPKTYVNESASAFVKFAMYKTEKFPTKQIDKSYTWLEKQTDALKNFVTAMKATPATTVGFSMVIDKNTKSENNNNNWGLKLPNFINTAFVRKQDNTNKHVAAVALTDAFIHEDITASDIAQIDAMVDQQQAAAQEEGDQISDETASEWLFWRRRSSPPPPPPKPVIKIIKRDTFKIGFHARGLKAINIAPDTWFDHGFVKKVAPSMQKWFGPKGKFSLIPRTVYVAFQPRVEITVGESQIGGIKEELSKSNGLFDYLIGGVRFKNYKTQPMADMEGAEQEEADSITIEEVKQEDDEQQVTAASEIPPPLQTAEEPKKNNKNHKKNKRNSKKNLRRELLRGNKQQQEEEEEESDKEPQYEAASEDKIEDETASEWLFWRRRRSPPPPPPPPPPVNKLEKLFKLVFQSRGSTPQIIGVASDVMP